MSIFKGDSIYKSGGGGGGYKDGGALVDGDFIKVENNTVSSYDNVSRDPINLYFEPKDGEVLNAVVELTTAVNATVNVYVVKNGFYYLLGNVGGDAVTAGNDYNVNITGDSFAIENVTAPSSEPQAIIIDGYIYGLKKYGSIYWADRDLQFNVPGCIKTNNTTYYTNANIKNLNCPPFEIPSDNDWNDLRSNYGFSEADLRSVNWGGNNSSGINLYKSGVWINGQIYSPNDYLTAIQPINPANDQIFVFYMNNGGGSGTTTSYAQATVIRPVIKQL